MPKKVKSITISQNQLLEILNDNIEVESKENQEVSPVMVDTTGNQELHLETVEIVEPQDAKQDLTETVVKVKKPRVKKEKVVPVTIAEEPETVQPEVIDLTRPIEVSDVLNVEPELTPKEVKLLQLVKCDKCNRKMTEQTLKYKHQLSCSGNKPKQAKTKEVKVEPVVEEIDIEPPAMLPLKRSTAHCALTARQDKINQKKEHYKALIVGAF